MMKIPEDERHSCSGDLPREGYGEALEWCSEEEDGRLFVTNCEYTSFVNFCPYCGYEARVKVDIEKYERRN